MIETKNKLLNIFEKLLVYLEDNNLSDACKETIEIQLNTINKIESFNNIDEIIDILICFFNRILLYLHDEIKKDELTGLAVLDVAFTFNDNDLNIICDKVARKIIG